MKKIISLMAFFCIASVQIIFAQYDMKAPLPLDPNVRTGKLANGITYYIRHNAEPKDRASFYIIQNVGALLENDDQNGLAHFLEHMAFNGTKHFPGRKGIVNMLEKHGVEFGRNINAYTAHNETVYNLSDVPTTNESLMDTCLLVLNDWSHYLELDNAEIDIERPVISEEWRTRRTSQFRIQSQTLPALLKGSKYAVRDVIGDLDIIKNFKYQTVKDFYHDWYRTDLQAIAIVGDFDADKMEQKVKDLFSKIPAIENPQPRPFFEVPEHEEINYALATDKEAQRSSVTINTVFPGTKAADKNHGYIRDQFISSFYNAMIGNRISELMQKGNPPFINGSIGFSGFVRGYNSYGISTTAKPNEEGLALEAILTENERVKRFGFNNSELERIKTNMLVRLESAYKEKDKTNNESYVDEIKSLFLEQEPMVDFEYYYNFAKQVIPTITVEEVSAKAKEGNITKNKTVIISGPSEDAKHLTKEEVLAIMEKVEKSNIEPYKDDIQDAALLAEDLKGSKIIATKKLPQFEAEEWTLANGAKVVFRKADYEKDDVSLIGYSKGGTSLYGIDMLPSANNASTFVGAYGLGDFNAIALKKILTGKQAACGASISGLSESVKGGSTPQDIETMFQLLYLRFENPRFDKEAHESMMSRNRALIPNMEKSPQKIMQDSLSLIMSNYNPRTLLFNEKYLDNISMEKIEQVYRDRIKDASDFTFFIVGNVDAATVKPLVEKYIGSIPSINRKETWKDNNVRMPKGKTVKEIELELETPKSTVITSFSKDMKYSVNNNICNNVLKGILDLRYVTNIREKEGGTYGVSVESGSSREPYESYSMTMSFDCDPAKANHLKSLIYAETERLAKEGPTAEEVDKVVKNILKNNEQAKPHNSYWMNVIFNYYQTGVNVADPKNSDDILKKLTPKDIQKFTQALFTNADVADIIFKPKN